MLKKNFQILKCKEDYFYCGKIEAKKAVKQKLFNSFTLKAVHRFKISILTTNISHTYILQRKKNSEARLHENENYARQEPQTSKHVVDQNDGLSDSLWVLVLGPLYHQGASKKQKKGEFGVWRFGKSRPSESFYLFGLFLVEMRKEGLVSSGDKIFKVSLEIT